jgi:signal transduction histidine kinase
VTLRASIKQKKQQSVTDMPQKQILHFEVEDTGPGISAKEISLIFDAFVQTEAGQKSQQGTGLGLPSVRNLSR